MAQSGRKRKRKGGSSGRTARVEPLPTAAEPGMSRTERKNAEARADLEPLEEGERPLPVTIGAIVALALVAVQIPLYFTFDGDERPPGTGFALFVVLMLVMAWGMWNVKYWAVLGFQALLGLLILIVALLALVAANIWTFLICVAIVVPASVLFWFMVKALARIQMPELPR